MQHSISAFSPYSDDVSKTTTKKKHKRKPLLPKNYDPNTPPDPERWLPKRERSTYRGKRKKQLNKGSQGAAVAGGGIGGTGSANISGKRSLILILFHYCIAHN